MYRQLPRQLPALGNSSYYGRTAELEGFSDVFKKIGGAVKNIVKAGIGAAKQPVTQAVTQAAVTEFSHIPGYPGVLVEQNRQQASNVVRDNLPLILVGGAVLLVLVASRRR